jgi:hypothetical protein
MERLNLSPQTLIADLLANSPAMIQLFLQWKTDCVGCSMAKFCTVADLCTYYQMELESVLSQIRERISPHESD